MILESVITCPHCAFKKEEAMLLSVPETQLVCDGCGKLIVPKPGDCCVHCSWGSVICPPMQEKRNGCCQD